VRIHSRLRRYAAAFSLGLLAACTKHKPADAARSPVAPDSSRLVGTTSDSALRIAAARLELYLSGALTTRPKLTFDSLQSGQPEGQTDRYVALATYRVLDTVWRDDTIEAAAEVVTVAEETGDPHSVNRYITTVRIRTDTLHWSMTRDSATGVWGVCGYPHEGVGFGHYGSDDQTKWEPPRQSWRRVRQMAESLQASAQQ
jgi:hypothetical protein